MNSKILSVAAVSLAVVAAAVAAIVVSVNRSSEAQARAETEAAAAEKAMALAKAATKTAESEAAKTRAAEAGLEAAKETRAANAAAAEKAKAESEVAAAKRAQAEDLRKKAEADAEAAKENRLAAKLKAEAAAAEKAKAMALQKAEAAKAEAAADQLAVEKLRSEKVIAEAKLLELRKIDFETAERDLREWRQDLEERERALVPEKTVADLAWAGGMEDTVIDSEGNVRKQTKKPYRAEDDRSLPRATRNLARVEREVSETAAQEVARTRAAVVVALERLYVAALADDRVVDADYYRKVLKALYPDWTFTGDGETLGESKFPLSNSPER